MNDSEEEMRASIGEATTVAVSTNAVRAETAGLSLAAHRISTESSTKEVHTFPTVPRSSARLVLTSHNIPVTQMATEVESDSHEERVARVRQLMRRPIHQRELPGMREVRAAMRLFRNLGERVGPVDFDGEIPRAIRRQQWSAVYVPLMWAAASGDRECPLLHWLSNAASRCPALHVGVSYMPGGDALYAGWDALHEAMESWGIQSREHLSEWIHNQGFPRPRWGAHFCARAQERILNGVVTRDVRGAAIEAVCVQVALQTCRQHGMPPEPSHNQQPTVPASSCDREDMLNSGWEWLDGVDVQQVFDKRFRVMQGCPHHVRGRFRQATRCALEARHNAIRAQNRISEIRAWKLFCLLPSLLLHRPIGGSRVSREDLLERFDKFAQGKWCALFEDAMKNDRSCKAKTKTPTFGGEGQGSMSEGSTWRSVPSTPVSCRRQCGARHQRHVQGNARQTAPGSCERDPRRSATV